MEHNSNFEYDLKLGVLGESHLSNILTNKKVEVKTDFKALTTGNVFVEYESREKKSGIATTKADWYAFLLSNDIIILVETSHLKTLCRKYHKTNRDAKGGDSNTSKGILLPLIDLFKNNGHET